jgi:metal-responsive CopG/Arc/MetJ family transcriptional regulator
MTTARSVTKSLPLLALRKPKRITITIPQAVYEKLEQLSHDDGRSMSNLAAYLLERGIQKEI